MTVGVFADSDEVRRFDAWVNRLDAFIPALDAIDADDPFTFCQDAWDIWQGVAAADPPSETNPAMLLVLGVFGALSGVKKSASRRVHRTLEAQNRLTLSAAHAALTDELKAIRKECDRWRHEGLPAADTVKAFSATAAAGLDVASHTADRLSA